MTDDAKLIEQARWPSARFWVYELEDEESEFDATPLVHALADAVERLTGELNLRTAERDEEIRERQEALRDAGIQIRFAEADRDRLAAAIKTAINELSGAYSSRTGALLTLRAALADTAPEADRG